MSARVQSFISFSLLHTNFYSTYSTTKWAQIITLPCMSGMDLFASLSRRDWVTCSEFSFKFKNNVFFQYTLDTESTDTFIFKTSRHHIIGKPAKKDWYYINSNDGQKDSNNSPVHNYFRSDCVVNKAADDQQMSTSMWWNMYHQVNPGKIFAAKLAKLSESKLCEKEIR